MLYFHFDLKEKFESLEGKTSKEYLRSLGLLSLMEEKAEVRPQQGGGRGAADLSLWAVIDHKEMEWPGARGSWGRTLEKVLCWERGWSVTRTGFSGKCLVSEPLRI